MSIDAFTAIQELIAECKGDSDRFAERLRAERIPHLSFSQVSTVEACPYRYYLQYVRGIEPEPVPEYFTKGKLLHQLIARDYSNGHGEREPAYEDEVALQFSGENLAHLLNALELHRENAWRGAQVLGVEHPFVMRVHESLPPLVGVIDLVLKDNGSYLLVDHKTGRNFYPDDELQVAIYARYIQQAYGGQSVRLFYDHYRWVKNLGRIRKPAFQRVEVRADPAHWPQDLARIRAAYGKIRAILESGSAPRCGECFRCPYRGLCR
jgi:CRISPR/Cas system-associated exonuclease Cas4 (RecB family)